MTKYGICIKCNIMYLFFYKSTDGMRIISQQSCYTYFWKEVKNGAVSILPFM